MTTYADLEQAKLLIESHSRICLDICQQWDRIYSDTKLFLDRVNKEQQSFLDKILVRKHAKKTIEEAIDDLAWETITNFSQLLHSIQNVNTMLQHLDIISMSQAGRTHAGTNDLESMSSYIRIILDCIDYAQQILNRRKELFSALQIVKEDEFPGKGDKKYAIKYLVRHYVKILEDILLSWRKEIHDLDGGGKS